MANPLCHPPLAELLGDRYTESPFERSFYQRDLAVVPHSLARLIGQTLPDAVARPRTAEEVAAIMRYAGERKLAVTPRAAGSTTFWNAVPLHGGLLLDLNGLAGLAALDTDHLTADVWAGTRWADLERALRRRGFAVLAYPTSAPAATVAGWFCMEGHGIGSLKYGGMAGHVAGLEAVLADGHIAQIAAATPDAPTVAELAGSEGTLAVITRIRLRLRPAPAAVGHHLLRFRDMATLQAAALDLSTARPTPYYLHFADDACGRLLTQAGFPPPADGALLAITYDGAAAEVAAGAATVERAAAQTAGEELPAAAAARAWDERFLALHLKRAGPSVLGTEAWLSVSQLAAYTANVARLARRQNLPIATYGMVVAPGMATVMSLFGCDDARPLAYLLALSLTGRLYEIAFRHGGRPYGIGVWNTPYLGRAFAAEELTAQRRRKQAFDPANLLNPGKRYAPPALLWPPTFRLGMAALAGIRRIGRRWLR